MRLQRIATVFFSVLTAWLLITSVPKAATLEESAKIEGEVVLYSSLNNEQIVTLVDAFKKKYPAIKPSFYRGTSERVLPGSATWVPMLTSRDVQKFGQALRSAGKNMTPTGEAVAVSATDQAQRPGSPLATIGSQL